MDDARGGARGGLRALVLTDGAPIPARGGVPPLRRRGALRTVPPLRVTGYAVRFSCTYREGSPRYRRAFSVPICSLLRRLADDARGIVLYSRHADDALGGVPPLQRLGALRGRSPRYASPLCRQWLAILWFCKDSFATVQRRNTSPATHVCCAVAVEVQRYYRPSWRR